MKKASVYFLFLLPLIFSILAILGFGFGYKAAVTLSCLLIIATAGKNRYWRFSSAWYIVLALVFSIIGDWFLSNKGDHFLMFAVGIGLYFFAHVGYLFYAWKNGSFKKFFTGLVLVVYLVFFILVLWPAIDEPILLGAVLVYLLISCLSLGAAVGLQARTVIKRSFASGIALILLSDTIISFKEFTAYQELNFLILPTYYAAHMLITFALVRSYLDDANHD